jgi:hypothetical protein
MKTLFYKEDDIAHQYFTEHVWFDQKVQKYCNGELEHKVIFEEVKNGFDYLSVSEKSTLLSEMNWMKHTKI